MSESYRYIPLTQGKIAIVDVDDYEWLSKKTWCAGWNGRDNSYYAVRGEFVALGVHKVIKMHSEILPAPKGKRTDHINRNTLDNRRSNLRICKHRQNLWNQKISSSNTSGYRGVSWDKNGRGGWAARIKIGKKYAFLGRFNDPADAARAWDTAALKQRGEFAQLNFPSEHIGAAK